MRFILIFFIIIGLNLYSQMKVEKGENKELKNKKLTAASVYINNIEYSYIINEEETKRAKSLYKTILKKEKPVYKLDIIPIFISNLQTAGKTFPFYNISQKKVTGEKGLLKIILFKNVIETYFKEKLFPMLQKNIQEEPNNAININSKSFYLKILLHHLSHFSGPSIIHDNVNKTVFIDELLSKNFTIIEEIRADMSALVITDQLVLENFLTEKEQKNIYKTHIAHILYIYKYGTEMQRKISSIQLNFFREKGGIVHNMITDKVSINMIEFKTITAKLLRKTTNFEKKAATSEIKTSEFIEKFSDIKGEATRKSIEVISPNGRESWTLGENQNIKWTTSGLSNNVKITLWKDDTLIGLIVKNLDPSLGVYRWKVGYYKENQGKAGTGFKIQIREQGGKTFKTNDVSNSTFNIKSK